MNMFFFNFLVFQKNNFRTTDIRNENYLLVTLSQIFVCEA